MESTLVVLRIVNMLVCISMPAALDLSPMKLRSTALPDGSDSGAESADERTFGMGMLSTATEHVA